jgi:MFS family permease
MFWNWWQAKRLTDRRQGETMSNTPNGSGAIERAEIEDTSLLAFYRDMNVPERRTFWACATGWALDGMDFMIYPLVIGTIIVLWKVDPGTAGLAGTVTLLASALGGWLGGYLADRIGRVRTLQITILWFSFFSLVCAFVQNFDQLLIARALLGIGFGGEWAAGAVLMGEAIRPQYRGRAVGSVQSGWAVGWGLAVLSQAALFSLLPPDIAWRYMFAIGALPALLVLYLRRYVEEPAIAERNFRRPDAEDHDPRFARCHRLPGRLLCHHFLGAALPHYRAQALHRIIHRLSVRADYRLLHRLSRRRVARRPHRPA